MIFANQRGQSLEYVVPDPNISIDTPVAIIDKNVDKHGNREVVEAFVKYLFEPDAQAEFIKVGYRPIDLTRSDPRFAQVKTLANIANMVAGKVSSKNSLPMAQSTTKFKQAKNNTVGAGTLKRINSHFAIV